MIPNCKELRCNCPTFYKLHIKHILFLREGQVPLSVHPSQEHYIITQEPANWIVF
jgi:hypothetical protein